MMILEDITTIVVGAKANDAVFNSMHESSNYNNTCQTKRYERNDICALKKRIQVPIRKYLSCITCHQAAGAAGITTDCIAKMIENCLRN